jgi:hypothetical protein
MVDFNTDFNIQSFTIEPITLIDEVSSEEFYIGTSINGRNTSKATWRIKKIWKDVTVWKVEFPDGDQSYKYIWDNRLSGYTYQ